MTLRITVAILAGFLCLPTWAQDDRLDDLSFDEVELPAEVNPYFGIGVGPVAGYFMLPMDGAKNRAREMNLPEPGSAMFITGIEVFSSIGVIDNVRAGFSWLGGGTSQSQSGTGMVLDEPLTPATRTLNYDIGLRTLTLEYVIQASRPFVIVPGIGISWMHQTLETSLVKDKSSWGEYSGQDNYGPASFSILERSVLGIVPRLSFEYSLTQIIAIRVGAAYVMQANDDTWTGNRTSEVTGVPTTFNIKGLNLNAGLFIGLIN